MTVHLSLTSVLLAATVLAVPVEVAQAQSSAAQATATPSAVSDPYRDQRILPDPSDPTARDALLRARGEAYHRADDSRQTEEELRTTRALNDEVAARNALADKADEAARLDYDAALARYQVEVRRNEEQAHATALANRAAQEQYDRDYAAWREQVQACQAGVRSACALPTPVSAPR